MTRAFSLSKLDLRDMDIATEDIKRIVERVPSAYEVGRRHLSEAYPLLRTEPKKAKKLINKALKEVKGESAVAAEFNRIREGIRFSNDPRMRQAEEKYRKLLAQGDYKGAMKQVSKLAAGTRDLRPPISVSDAGSGDGSIRIENGSDRSVIVVQARGPPAVVFTPSSFEIEPFGSRILECSGFEGRPLEVTVEYRCAGADRSLTARIAFR